MQIWGCKFTTIYNSELIEHNNMEHVADESFLYPNSNMETACPDCDEMKKAWPVPNSPTLAGVNYEIQNHERIG